MTAAGLLKDWEPETAVVWLELLKDIDSRWFQKAVIEICRTQTEFYPGTNIPGLIREMANIIRSKEFQETKRIEQEKYFEQCRLEAVPANELEETNKKLNLELKETQKTIH